MKCCKFKVSSVFLVVAVIFTSFYFYQSHVDSKNFIGLFHDVGWGRFENISDEASPYLLGKQQAEVIQFLKQQKFKITVYRKETVDPMLHKKSEMQNNINFEDLIIAERGPGWRFWRLFINYKISLYTSNDKVINIVAVVDTPIYP